MASKAILTTGLLLVLTLPLGSGQGLGNEGEAPARDFKVPAGTTAYVTEPIRAVLVEIDGTLVNAGPDDLLIEADTIRVGPEAEVRASDGLPSPSHIATNARSLDAMAGASVILRAKSIQLDNGSTVRAGCGGGAGYAYGTDSAAAGDGGKGGDVRFETEDLQAADGAYVLPGAGGSGGDASTESPWGMSVAATAGNGGDAGDTFVNGESATFAYKPLVCSSLNGSPKVHALAADCPEADLAADFVDWNQGVLLYRLDAVDASTGQPSSSFSPSDAACEFVDALLGFAGTAPGLSETPQFPCNSPQGANGGINLLGDGGDGGDACNNAKGGDGGPGGDGGSGPFTCGDGHRGETGGAGTAATATAGSGGLGRRNGGDGGDASAVGMGGTGGKGGTGGTRHMWFGGCNGGPGGPGGAGTGGNANAGSGGDGLCNGGAKGSADARGIGGNGGAGGQAGAGGTGGPAGSGGVGTAGTTTPGVTGNGYGICA